MTTKGKEKVRNERKQVEVGVDCDTQRLYGDINGAIRYMEEIRDAHKGVNIMLDEHWTGYEDMEMRFVYWREENDEEFTRRQEREEWERKRAEEERKRTAARKRDLDEYNRLRTKLGMGR